MVLQSDAYYACMILLRFIYLFIILLLCLFIDFLFIYLFIFFLGGGCCVEFVNVGGGLGIPYRPEEEAVDVRIPCVWFIGLWYLFFETQEKCDMLPFHSN